MKQAFIFMATLLLSITALQSQNSTRSTYLSSNLYLSGPNEPQVKFTDKDTVLSNETKVNPEMENPPKEELEVIDLGVIRPSPRQERAIEKKNIPTDDELEVIELGVITPSTRYEQPSDDSEETMIMMVDEETGEEYFIRKNPAPSQFKALQDKKKYQRKVKKLENKGKNPSTT